jgi:hypothetical protein
MSVLAVDLSGHVHSLVSIDQGCTMPHPVVQNALPVIDMAGADLPTVAAQIRAASTGPGFFYLRGHGVAPEVIAQAATAARRGN